MSLYKIIIYKEPTPAEKAKGEDVRYQYGLLEAESHFQAEEKAKRGVQPDLGAPGLEVAWLLLGG